MRPPGAGEHHAVGAVPDRRREPVEAADQGRALALEDRPGVRVEPRPPPGDLAGIGPVRPRDAGRRRARGRVPGAVEGPGERGVHRLGRRAAGQGHGRGPEGGEHAVDIGEQRGVALPQRCPRAGGRARRRAPPPGHRPREHLAGPGQRRPRDGEPRRRGAGQGGGHGAARTAAASSSPAT
ncbi:hypothetical protein [Actinomycetospora sp. CA-053990]|uniref:hypothetical protein n=1 Tax=Actinomycetospora sp. CA-053990 TaxID=3239891 RepID=UPI003D8D1496